MKAPRTCFIDFLLECPAGKPHESAQQRDILRAALKLAPEFNPEHWEAKTLPFQWSADRSRAWEQKVDELHRNGGIKIALQHHGAHKVQRESIVGREREFATRCDC